METSLSTGEIKKMQDELKVNVLKATTEVSRQPSSSPLFTVELNSIFGVSSSIKGKYTQCDLYHTIRLYCYADIKEKDL